MAVRACSLVGIPEFPSMEKILPILLHCPDFFFLQICIVTVFHRVTVFQTQIGERDRETDRYRYGTGTIIQE